MGRGANQPAQRFLLAAAGVAGAHVSFSAGEKMIPPLVMPPGAPHIRAMPRTNTTSCQFILAGFVAAIFAVVPAHAKILWSDPGARVVHETGIGVDILGGKVKRDDKISDTLYFKFHVDPIS